MASSTSTGTFDITRTTGACAFSRRSMNDVRIPAAKEITSWSSRTWCEICSQRRSMSWGFTVRISVSAHATASGFDSVVATPCRSASS